MGSLWGCLVSGRTGTGREHALPISRSVLNDIVKGQSEVTVTVAFRIAKMLEMSLHHVLTGTALPPGTSKHRGRTVMNVR